MDLPCRSDLPRIPRACEPVLRARESGAAKPPFAHRSDQTLRLSPQTRERATPATTRHGGRFARPTVNKPVDFEGSRPAETPWSKRPRTLDGVLSAPEGVKGDSFATRARGADRNGGETATRARPFLPKARWSRRSALVAIAASIAYRRRLPVQPTHASWRCSRFHRSISRARCDGRKPRPDMSRCQSGAWSKCCS